MLFLIPIIFLISLQQFLTLAFIPLIRTGEYKISYWIFIYVFLGLTTILPLFIKDILKKFNTKTAALICLFLIMIIEIIIFYNETYNNIITLRILETLPASMLCILGRVYLARNIKDDVVSKIMPIIVACTSIAPFTAPLLGYFISQKLGVKYIHITLSICALIGNILVLFYWKKDRKIEKAIKNSTFNLFLTKENYLVLVYLFFSSLITSFEILYSSDMTLVVTNIHSNSILLQFLFCSEIGILCGTLISFLKLKIHINNYSIIFIFFVSMILMMSFYHDIYILLFDSILISCLIGVVYSHTNTKIISLTRENPFMWNSISTFFVGSSILLCSFFLEHRQSSNYPILATFAAASSLIYLLIVFSRKIFYLNFSSINQP